MVEISSQSPDANPKVSIIVIVTVTEVEAQAVLEVFSQFPNKELTRYYIGENIYFNLGIHGGALVFMVQSEMGIGTPGGTIVTVSDAIRDLHPQAIISCGIAYGLRPEKQKLGDILVSRQLEYYEPQKLDLKQGQMQRGDRVMAPDKLLRHFRSGNHDWKGAPTHCGLVLSGEKLVNDARFRDWLLEVEPEAVGGEMEGAGLYTAAHHTKVDWILIKAICDWADGTKDDEAQQLAAHNAARFVLHVLQLGGWSSEPEMIKPLSTEDHFSARSAQTSNEDQQFSQLKTGQKSNPFISGRPVKPNEFVDRGPELSTVFNRLRNSDSTAIIGEPHIGKTSFLNHIANKKTQMSYLEEKSQSFVFSPINLHYISNEFVPITFWKRALGPLRKFPYRDDIASRLEQLDKTGYESESLVEFFDYFDEEGQQLILLLDEFEVLLDHPKFQEFAFYATLHTVIASRGCSLVLASRVPLSEIQKRIHRLPFSWGSTVFNSLIELRLKSFDKKHVETILSLAGDAFSSRDKLFIRSITGHHPYLVQAMAASLWETNGEFRYKCATENFCSSAFSHFDDLWHTLQDRERATLIVIGLIECGKCKLGSKFDFTEFLKLEKLGAGLYDLEKLGLVDHTAQGQYQFDEHVLWQGQQWKLKSRAMVCWVYEIVIAGTHIFPAYDRWLNREGFAPVLTLEQWDLLLRTIRLSIGPRICDISSTIESIFK